MTFSSVDLREYLKGDTQKTRNYFSALRRYLKIDTRSELIKCNRNGTPNEMFSCIMYCDVSKAKKLATIKSQSTNKKVNTSMWLDIKEFTETFKKDK